MSRRTYRQADGDGCAVESDHHGENGERAKDEPYSMAGAEFDFSIAVFRRLWFNHGV